MYITLTHTHMCTQNKLTTCQGESETNLCYILIYTSVHLQIKEGRKERKGKRERGKEDRR